MSSVVWPTKNRTIFNWWTSRMLVFCSVVRSCTISPPSSMKFFMAPRPRYRQPRLNSSLLDVVDRWRSLLMLSRASLLVWARNKIDGESHENVEKIINSPCTSANVFRRGRVFLCFFAVNRQTFLDCPRLSSLNTQTKAQMVADVNRETLFFSFFNTVAEPESSSVLCFFSLSLSLILPLAQEYR